MPIHLWTGGSNPAEVFLKSSIAMGRCASEAGGAPGKAGRAPISAGGVLRWRTMSGLPSDHPPRRARACGEPGGGGYGVKARAASPSGDAPPTAGTLPPEAERSARKRGEARNGNREKEKRAKSACKPGSVRRRTSATVIPLGRRLPGGSSNLPGGDASSAIAPLFGLAPDGVCHAVTVTGHAVGSYPQPARAGHRERCRFPRRFTLAGSHRKRAWAVYFLLHRVSRACGDCGMLPPRSDDYTPLPLTRSLEGTFHRLTTSGH